MKKYIKIFLIACLAIVMLLSQATQMAAVSGSEKANGLGPVKAENVTLVKKITVKGAPTAPAKKERRAATGILGTGLPEGGTRYALVIGISDYPDTLNDLEFADKDATSVAEDVLPGYGFLPDNIDVLLNENARWSVIKSKILNLSEILTPKDELVFFFSGHGSYGYADDYDEISLDQSIVVCNDGYTKLENIWDGELKEWFSGFKTTRIVFVFDSCLSGGMQVLAETSGRVVNMGSTISGYSYEGDWGGGHGQFTYYFALQGLGLNFADTFPDDNNTTIEEAFDYAKSKCKRQKPTIADSFEHDLLLDFPE